MPCKTEKEKIDFQNFLKLCIESAQLTQQPASVFNQLINNASYNDHESSRSYFSDEDDSSSEY